MCIDQLLHPTVFNQTVNTGCAWQTSKAALCDGELFKSVQHTQKKCSLPSKPEQHLSNMKHTHQV